MHRHSTLFTTFILSSPFTLPFASAFAADNSADARDEVVVTATRVPQPLGAVVASVTVLNRDDIERRQAQDFSDLIAQVPGIDVSRDGGPGAISSLFLRGTNNEHTLILLDGQRISSATLGSTSFQFIDPAQVERVEVVRGPKSSLYGSDAIGGVVQIFTRRATAHPSAYVTAGYGAYNTQELGAGGQGKWQQFRLSAHVSEYFTGGINNLDETTPPNNDRDAYRNNSASVNAGYDFANGGALDLNHFYTGSKNEFDDYATYDGVSEPYSNSWIQNTNLNLKLPLTSFWSSNWTIGRAIDDSDSFDKRNIDPSGRSSFRTTRKSASWQNDFTIPHRQTLTAGIDYYEDSLDSSAQYIDSASGAVLRSRDNVGYFAQYLLDGDVANIQAGLRQDDNEAFGKKNTRNIAVGFHLPAQHLLTFSYGTAFKAPTFNALYFPPDAYGNHGNPDVKPENSESYEIDLRGNYPTVQWSLAVYQTKIKDLIEWAPIDPNDPFSGYTPSNVNSAKIRGGELTVNAQLQEWLIATSLSYTDPRDESTDNLLVKRARRSAKLDLDRPWRDWSFGGSWRAQDSRYADTGNTQELQGFGLLDLRASYQIASAWQVKLNLTNVLDKKYVLNRTYNDLDFNQQRFGWLLSLTYRLQ
jgi:vitamin B12 transporter